MTAPSNAGYGSIVWNAVADIFATADGEDPTFEGVTGLAQTYAHALAPR